MYFLGTYTFSWFDEQKGIALDQLEMRAFRLHATVQCITDSACSADSCLVMLEAWTHTAVGQTPILPLTPPSLLQHECITRYFELPLFSSVLQGQTYVSCVLHLTQQCTSILVCV